MLEEANRAGFISETIQKFLSTFQNHLVKWNWRLSRIFHEFEYYICEVSWRSKAQVKVKDFAGEVIPPVKEWVWFLEEWFSFGVTNFSVLVSHDSESLHLFLFA